MKEELKEILKIKVDIAKGRVNVQTSKGKHIMVFVPSHIDSDSSLNTCFKVEVIHPQNRFNVSIANVGENTWRNIYYPVGEEVKVLNIGRVTIDNSDLWIDLNLDGRDNITGTFRQQLDIRGQSCYVRLVGLEDYVLYEYVELEITIKK